MLSSSAFSILSTASAYGVLISIALFSLKRGNRQANLFLASFLFLLSLSTLLHATHYAGQTTHYPHLHLLYASFGFLYGPLLFFHLGSLMNASGDWSTRRLIRKHGLPFSLFLLYQIPFLFSSETDKTMVLERGFLYWPHDRKVYDLLQNLSLACYIAASFRLTIHFRNKKNPSDLIHSTISVWSLLIIFYVALATLLAAIQSLSGDALGTWLMLLTSAGFFAMTGYFWFLYPEAFISTLGPNVISKYQKSGLKDDDSKRFEKKLLSLMENDRPYLNPSLSLKDLASQVGINEVYLSQIINEKIGVSFFDFLNRYRVQEVTRKLLDSPENENQTLLDIAYGTGFNSKSTFYSAFKKETGLTPGAYVKKHRS